MKKTQPRSPKLRSGEKIGHYAAMASAFLLLSKSAHADIQYTDVDVILDFDDLLIDFDGDGIFDAQVLQTTYYGTELVGFNGFSNAFVGTGTGFVYPSALASGALIGAAGTAIPSIIAGTGLFPWGSLNYGSSFGFWIPAIPGDTVDAYVGMEFLAGDGNTYNAWVRCKIAGPDEVLVVGYAWEDTPGLPIAAGDTGPLGVPAGLATALSAADISDNGNGTDLELRFTRATDESTIGEYRAIAVKADSVLVFSQADAETLAADQYVASAPSGSDPVLAFGAASKDADGDLIAPGIAYRCFVLSIADGTIATLNDLSDPSNEVTLLASAQTARNLEAADVGNNGNGSDLRVVYDNAVDESTVLEYRILVVDSADVATFDLATAEAVSAANYTPRTPVGGVSNVLLTATSTTVNGTLIANDQPYRVFVLSVADGVNAQLNALSDPSNPITLRMVSALGEPVPASATVWTANSLLFVQTDPTYSGGTCTLMDVDGRRHQSWSIRQSFEQFTLPSGLSAGWYWVEVERRGQRSGSKVFIQP